MKCLLFYSSCLSLVNLNSVSISNKMLNIHLEYITEILDKFSFNKGYLQYASKFFPCAKSLPTIILPTREMLITLRSNDITSWTFFIRRDLVSVKSISPFQPASMLKPFGVNAPLRNSFVSGFIYFLITSHNSSPLPQPLGIVRTALK